MRDGRAGLEDIGRLTPITLLIVISFMKEKKSNDNFMNLKGKTIKTAAWLPQSGPGLDFPRVAVRGDVVSAPRFVLVLAASGYPKGSCEGRLRGV